MKKLLISLLFVTLALPVLAQDNNRNNEEKEEKKNWFQRLFTKQPVEIHDTVYIFVNEYNEEREEDDELMEDEERSGAIPMPFDTLNTDDKFQKVILFDNGSWAYYDIPKPELPDFISNDHWMTNQVHAYYDVNVKDLPEVMNVVLCDSVHGWHIPGDGPVVSPYKVRKGHNHQGVDLDVEYGGPIYAAFDGIVRVALPTRYTGGYGNVVVLRHANGLWCQRTTW